MTLPLKRVALAVITRDGKVLVARRKSGEHLEGTWEFPGGKIEPGEKPGEAAVRECMEETGLMVRPRRLLAVHSHDYETFTVKLHAVWCAPMEDGTGDPVGEGHPTRWVTWDELETMELPPANHELIRKLRVLLDPARYQIVIENPPDSEQPSSVVSGRTKRRTHDEES